MNLSRKSHKIMPDSCIITEDRLLLNELKSNRKMILSLAAQFDATHIRVFGSVARGEERPDSDIDFLVHFEHGYDMFRQRIPFVERLAALLGRKVDLIPEHELNRHIRDDVLSECVEL
ncbi:MAG: nucleotidyltransferase domain-containing protein [Mariprofundaceae bacterium]|nr:nucleotidyltransferase domain-containing protein [Mariprofundaceae bacterium]